MADCKTSFGPWWLWREITRCGAGDYLAVTATFDLFKLKQLPEMRVVFERILGVGRWWAGDKIIELRDMETGLFWAKTSTDPMWGRIILRSAQAEGGLESATAKAAWLDECGQNKFDLGQYEAVLRRLSLHQGRILGTTTLYNRGWVKGQVYDRWKAGDPDFDVIQFASNLNPAFPQTEYERAERTLPTWKLRMFYRGEFDKPAGLVYDCFDEDLHIVEPFHIPNDWPRVVGIDPIGAAIVAIFLAWDDASKRLHWYDEYYGLYGKTTEEHAIGVKKKAAEQGGPTVAWVAGAKSERQARLDWQTAGIPVIEPPISDVESGIDRLYGLLKGYSLVIHRNCKHSLAEIGSYSRVLDENDQPMEKIEDKESYHCLIGDTMIATDKGDIPLRDIAVNDRVLTRYGYRRVSDVACTNPNAEVYEVEFSNGKTLVGTGNHPVWVENKGYTDLRFLRYGDIVVTPNNEEVLQWEKAGKKNRCISMARVGFGIPILRDGATNISRHRSHFTSMFGKCITVGQYQINTLFTILTAILPITRLKTSLQCPNQNMPDYTSQTAITLTDCANLPKSDVNMLKPGMDHRLEGNSTKRLANLPGSLHTRLSNHVKTVAKNMKLGILQSVILGFVPTVVGQHGGANLVWTTNRELAHFVAQNSRSTDTRKENTVLVIAQARPVELKEQEQHAHFVGKNLSTMPATGGYTVRGNVNISPHVVSLRRLEQHNKVYNLEVEDAHEFFANGILTHNCLDAARYACAWLTEPRETASVIYPLQQIGHY